MNTIKLNGKANGNGANAAATAVQTPQAKSGALQNSTAFDDKKDDAKKIDVAPTANGLSSAQPQNEAPKADAPKAEEKPLASEKPALNLEGTLKLVEELHKIKVHRDNLLNTIKTLDDFKVMVQEDDSEDIESTHFQGCKLTIEDDDRNSFTTKNPFIIKAVAEFVNKLCTSKLSEIEANLVIPA